MSPASGRCLDSSNAAVESFGRKKLSEWRRLEKQMILDDTKNDEGRGSPHKKQSLLHQKIFEEIKGDKAIPADSAAELGQDAMDQSYE